MGFWVWVRGLGLRVLGWLKFRMGFWVCYTAAIGDTQEKNRCYPFEAWELLSPESRKSLFPKGPNTCTTAFLRLHHGFVGTTMVFCRVHVPMKYTLGPSRINENPSERQCIQLLRSLALRALEPNPQRAQSTYVGFSFFGELPI